MSNARDWRRPTPTSISAGFTVAGLVLVLVGVHLVDSNPHGHQLGGALVAVGSALFVSIPVGFVVQAAQRRYEEARTASEGETARLAAIDLALLTTQNLVGIDLSRLILRDRYLVAKVLDRANLASCDLSGCNLTDARLVEADLTGATLDGADLTDADLSGADLTGASLRGVGDIDSTRLTNIFYDSTTTWPDGFTPPTI